MSFSPELEMLFARFENLYQCWRKGMVDPNVKNEEIERVYKQMPVKNKAGACPHGKTPLTCSECWFQGFNDTPKDERGDAI